MSVAHLTYFSVSNFKKFGHLELTDLGQFNLIVGDNNQGKTSLLEALLVNENGQDIVRNLCKALNLRGIDLAPKLTYSSKGTIENVQFPVESYLDYLKKDKKEHLRFAFKNKIEPFFRIAQIDSMPTEQAAVKNLDIEIETAISGILNRLKIDSRYIHFYHYIVVNTNFKPLTDNNFFDDLEARTPPTDFELYEPLIQTNINQWDIPFITTTSVQPFHLADLYSKEVGTSRKEKKDLVSALRFIIPDVEDIEIHKINGIEHLLLGLSGNDELVPVSQFGESVNRSIQLLLQIAKYKGKRLMIDEIDTGIHHTRLKDFMKTLIQVADKYEVQLFMTTHSLECQQAFADAFDTQEMERFKPEVRNLTLMTNKDGQSEAQSLKYESLKVALETGFELRGG